MRTSRNLYVADIVAMISLADWDMRTSRNSLEDVSKTTLSLADWDMRTSRNTGIPLNIC